MFCQPSNTNKTASLQVKVPERILLVSSQSSLSLSFTLHCISHQAAELGGQSAEKFYAAQVKDQTGLSISPLTTDLNSQQEPGTFSFEMKITVERDMMEMIRKLEKFHQVVTDSTWSVVMRRIRRGDLKTLQLTFTDTDWGLVVRSVRLGQERNVIRTSLANILSQLDQDGEDNNQLCLVDLINQLIRSEDLLKSS